MFKFLLSKGTAVWAGLVLLRPPFIAFATVPLMKMYRSYVSKHIVLSRMCLIAEMTDIFRASIVVLQMFHHFRRCIIRISTTTLELWQHRAQNERTCEKRNDIFWLAILNIKFAYYKYCFLL